MESDAEKRHTAVVAEISAHGDSTAPPKAALTHTSGTRPSVAGSVSISRSQYRRRLERVASAEFHSHRAAALDFLGDGTTALHYSYQDMSSDQPPKFDCPTQAHSIRLVFYDTNALKTVSPKIFDASDSLSVLTHRTSAFTYCQHCSTANRFPQVRIANLVGMH